MTYLLKKSYLQTFLLSSLCFILNGCNLFPYTVEVKNKFQEASPLSKTDIIRVILPNDFPEFIKKHSRYASNFPLKQENSGECMITAKKDTEKALQELGYYVLGKNRKLDSNKIPTVIAIVDSAPVENSQVTVQKGTELVPDYSRIDGDPYSPTFGQNLYDISVPTYVTMTTFYYKIRLLRPKGKTNKLLECNSSSNAYGYCIAPALTKLTDYQTIFTSDAKMDSDYMGCSGLEEHKRFAFAVFYQYPNISGKKFIYFHSFSSRPYKVEDKNNDY